MDQRLSLVTLGVSDLERAASFYERGLGRRRGTNNDGVVFFQTPGMIVALWPRTSLAHDTGLAICAASPTELSLGHNVSSREEVDAVMASAEAAGARIVKPAKETFWGGYAGYFQDPDGHLWEVVWNPQWHE